MTVDSENVKSKPWVKILLVISLGLNLAIASFVIGISIKGPPARRTPQNQDAVAFLSFALPVEYRHEIRRELLSHQAELRPNRNALRGLRDEMVLLLEAEPFEISKVESLLERQRSQFLSMGELAHDALIRRIAELTPSERQTYVNSLRRGNPGRHK